MWQVLEMTLILTHQLAANTSVLHPRKLIGMQSSFTDSQYDTVTRIAAPQPKARLGVVRYESFSPPKDAQLYSSGDNRISGRVLAPSLPGSGWWDEVLFSGPVIVRTDEDKALDGCSWRMYYYGRDKEHWNHGVKALAGTPFGRVGMAVSQDGLYWTRYRGHLSGGAILDPNEDKAAFDSVQLGCSDVHLMPDGTWRMYYYGGGMDEMPLPGWPEGATYKGTIMRPGLATSSDGVRWRRQNGPLFDIGARGEWDHVAAAWPRVLQMPKSSQSGHATSPASGKETSPDSEWVMYYQTVGDPKSPEQQPEGGMQADLEPGLAAKGYCYTVGIATSADGMSNWKKHGPCLFRGPLGAWDEAGVNKRHIISVGDCYLMFYEGMSYSGEYAIGLAVSNDGFTWKKDPHAGGQPGGPILRARRGGNFWDNFLVSAPHVVMNQDGSFWMYYVGVGDIQGTGRTRGVGIAISDGQNFRSWKRIGEA